MDHLNTSRSAAGTTLPAPHQITAAPASTHCKLEVGKAVTLRAKQLSVLRISHGRVWATLSDAGPYSRVLGGDHFLSRGQSLSLLPGQELVIESFAPSANNLVATAHFSWETPGVMASTPQEARAVHPAIDVGVQQPLRDLRHALGLAAGACSRLVQALAHCAATMPLTLLGIVAIFLIARRPCITCPDNPFDIQKGPL